MFFTHLYNTLRLHLYLPSHRARLRLWAERPKTQLPLWAMWRGLFLHSRWTTYMSAAVQPRLLAAGYNSLRYLLFVAVLLLFVFLSARLDAMPAPLFAVGLHLENMILLFCFIGGNAYGLIAAIWTHQNALLHFYMGNTHRAAQPPITVTAGATFAGPDAYRVEVAAKHLYALRQLLHLTTMRVSRTPATYASSLDDRPLARPLSGGTFPLSMLAYDQLYHTRATPAPLAISLMKTAELRRLSRRLFNLLESGPSDLLYPTTITQLRATLGTAAATPDFKALSPGVAPAALLNLPRVSLAAPYGQNYEWSFGGFLRRAQGLTTHSADTTRWTPGLLIQPAPSTLPLTAAADFLAHPYVATPTTWLTADRLQLLGDLSATPDYYLSSTAADFVLGGAPSCTPAVFQVDETAAAPLLLLG